MKPLAPFLFVLMLLTCGTHPLSQAPEQRIHKIREFMADILDPLPGSFQYKIPFKKACEKNLEALYFIINDPEILKKSGIPSEIIQALPIDFDKLKGYSLEVIQKELGKQPDSFFERNQEQIDKAVTNFKFDLEQLKAIKVPKLGTAWTDFFQKVLNNYFPNLNTEDRKRILAYMIRHLKRGTDPTQTLLSWVYASGPYFQKYMQLMALHP